MMSKPQHILIAILLSFFVGTSFGAEAKHNMVVTVHPLATDAAVKVLRDGGNAIDAAVAAGLTLGVVDGHNSGIGGGCFMLIRLADGRVFALDGREMAPAKATRDMYICDGKADTKLSQTGPLAVGIPGSVAVYEHAMQQFGKKKFADVLLPAAQLAEGGFPIDAKYAKKILGTVVQISEFPETKRILLNAEGLPREPGDMFKQPELARTYRNIAASGSDYFYHGAFAKSVSDWMSKNGGIVTESDFSNYKLKEREPLTTKYRGYTIIGFPPPSSGGVHVAQILNILSKFELADLEKKDPALRIHVMAEAMKLAFADRAFWLGDPDFAKVPRGLVEQTYADDLVKKIDLTKALASVDHGTPAKADEDIFGKHTTHIAVADDQGNWVAMTQTVNTAFGSKVIVPGTGVILNNQMDDFSIQPGVPNYFKLVGSEANAIAPGKRPLSSMSPTIVLDPAGKPFMTVGAAGGPKIITQVVLAISNVIDLHDDLVTALKRPRFHHQWSPAELWIEKTFDPSVLKRLGEMGHAVKAANPEGACNAIVIQNGTFVGVSEPRLNGKAAGN
ncbi:MAG: gamma-glutamyltransferase [Burkholderiales bacterium]|nr:gamma-glutamyltransferase [Phycisphaerae bacterium]